MIYFKCLKKALAFYICCCKYYKLAKRKRQFNHSKWLGGWGESENSLSPCPVLYLGAELKVALYLKSVNPK